MKIVTIKDQHALAVRVRLDVSVLLRDLALLLEANLYLVESLITLAEESLQVRAN